MRQEISLLSIRILLLHNAGFQSRSKLLSAAKMKFHVVLALVSLNTMAIAGSNDTIPYIDQLYRNSFGTPGKNATYDYIVVGGGTAGNTVSSR